MANYATVIVPGVAGLGLFAVLRRLTVRPSVAGIAAIATALVVMIVIFAAIILTGSY